ncbi:MAG: hypothetical protein GKR92_05490 [Gammaproteobacteria bacterium]|nr:MAG: hypothetical protein GKR92_05490 [Gammaproteobacteria bacterium]
MANPFEKRTTEYMRDDAAFLSVVAPEPLHTFFEKHSKEGTLYDRLSMIIGTPGSGKTTISSLLQYKTVQTLLDNPNLSEYKPLVNALKKCGIIEVSGNTLAIKFLGCRIPMESEYRDFWELPYSLDVKMGLLKSFLQARAMLSWLRGLEDASHVKLSMINLQYREGAEAAETSIGGCNGASLFERAKEIERSIYEIGTALVPPLEEDLGKIATGSYHPFDAIKYFTFDRAGGSILLRPMVMFDDVHTLHPDQLTILVNWLVKREMKIARWMLMRLDAQTPQSVLLEELDTNSVIEQESPVKPSREITYIWLQSSKDRAKKRSEFRKMARSMADKYLRLMPVFSRQGLTSFPDLLNTNIPPISGSKIEKLKSKLENLRHKVIVSNKIYEEFKRDVDAYFSTAQTIDNSEDVKLAMLHIMVHRYTKRVPQASLFDQNDDQSNSVELNKPMKVSSGLADGARIFLMHEYGRPYYYGIDAVCDGGSENAEQFLQLASQLVNAAETRIIRSQPASLPPSYQHKMIIDRAIEMVREWDFPKNREMRKLCKQIAFECLQKSLEPNAPLNGGANAFGIPQDEFSKIPSQYPELAKILKFGVAYNAISIKPSQSTKNKMWSLIELSGPVIISSGLTLSRGGFLERTVEDLLHPLEE